MVTNKMLPVKCGSRDLWLTARVMLRNGEVHVRKTAR